MPLQWLQKGELPAPAKPHLRGEDPYYNCYHLGNHSSGTTTAAPIGGVDHRWFELKRAAAVDGCELSFSCSVLPLFHRQTALVPPPATCVEGGEVFLLDMGEPVRIKALAEQMVRLGGLSVRDASNPAGEIEIVCN